jgi:hypothetical protein
MLNLREIAAWVAPLIGIEIKLVGFDPGLECRRRATTASIPTYVRLETSRWTSNDSTQTARQRRTETG